MSAGPDVVLSPRWWRLGVTAAVGALIALFLSAAAVDGFVRHRSTAVTIAVVLDLVGVIALVLRRRYPATVLAVEIVVAATVLSLAGAAVSSGAIFFAVVALYSFGTRRTPTQTILVAAGTGLTVALVASLAQREFNPAIPDIALFTAATAVSLYVRSHRALMASYRERAEQAEHEQQWTTVRAVTAERVRIARELHDVVAHHVSLLVVQAGAVRETLPADHVTRPVLDSMIDGGRQAMGEMRGMLDALRLDDGGVSEPGVSEPGVSEPGVSEGQVSEVHEPAPLRSPQPTSDQIPGLVAGAQAAGLPVTLHVDGEPAPTAPGTSLAAYRIVQEALTNALRHAPGAFTTVELSYGPRSLSICVRNGPAPRLAGRAADRLSGTSGSSGTSGRGHGIVGMRERAGLAHGTITVGPTNDGWEVLVTLPIGPAPTAGRAAAALPAPPAQPAPPAGAPTRTPTASPTAL